MEEQKSNRKEHEIVFSKVIKAGKRVYYLDVKKNRSQELFLTITESKKKVFGEDGQDSDIQYEKHKLFLYQEDFNKFMDGMSEAFSYIDRWNGEHPEECGGKVRLYRPGQSAANIRFESAAETAHETEESADAGSDFDKSRYNVEMDF